MYLTIIIDLVLTSILLFKFLLCILESARRKSKESDEEFIQRVDYSIGCQSFNMGKKIQYMLQSISVRL